MLYNNFLFYLKNLKINSKNFFIEAEGKYNRLINFINEYNIYSTIKIDIYSDGFIILDDDANKYGLELRLYLEDKPPDDILNYYNFKLNNNYRNNYKYRMNNNNVIIRLLMDGFYIGLN